MENRSLPLIKISQSQPIPLSRSPSPHWTKSCVPQRIGIGVGNGRARSLPRVQIDDIRLLRLSAGQNIRPGGLPPHTQWESDVGWKVLEQESEIVVNVSFKLIAALRRRSALGESSLWVAASFRLVYKVCPFTDLSEANYEAFAFMNGIYNVHGRIGVNWCIRHWCG